MMAGSFIRSVAIASVGVLGAVAITCGGSDDNVTNSNVGGGSTNSGGQGGGTATGGSGAGFNTDSCDPPCVAPQFCSVTGVCLDEGTCADDGDCPTGATCTDQGVCSGCEPPNLLIVLDRSCSMRNNVAGISKWDHAVTALVKLTTDYQGMIRYGLTLFPDTVAPQCQQDSIAIPVGNDNEQAIQTLLTDSQVNTDPYFPNGPCVTNIDTAMQQAANDEPAFNDVDRPSYALLLTDGKQYGCNAAGGDSGTTQIITDMFQQRGIPTFVVGFGSGVDPAQLNIFADAGGVPTNDASCSPDPCKFYKAEDGATLEAALEAIAAQVSCDPDVVD